MAPGRGSKSKGKPKSTPKPSTGKKSKKQEEESIDVKLEVSDNSYFITVFQIREEHLRDSDNNQEIQIPSAIKLLTNSSLSKALRRAQVKVFDVLSHDDINRLSMIEPLQVPQAVTLQLQRFFNYIQNEKNTEHSFEDFKGNGSYRSGFDKLSPEERKLYSQEISRITAELQLTNKTKPTGEKKRIQKAIQKGIV